MSPSPAGLIEVQHRILQPGAHSFAAIGSHPDPKILRVRNDLGRSGAGHGFLLHRMEIACKQAAIFTEHIMFHAVYADGLSLMFALVANVEHGLDRKSTRLNSSH